MNPKHRREAREPTEKVTLLRRRQEPSNNDGPDDISREQLKAFSDQLDEHLKAFNAVVDERLNLLDKRLEKVFDETLQVLGEKREVLPVPDRSVHPKWPNFKALFHLRNP